MDLNAIKKRLGEMQNQTSNNSGGGKQLFWKPSVGKQVVRVVPNKYNKEFLNMAADDEIGDHTDMAQRRDIKLTTVGPEVTGTPYNKTSIGPSMKTSPIAEDSEVVKSCLEDQADPMKVFKPLTYDEMKEALQEWLAPEGSEEEGSIVSEPAVAFDSDTKKSNYSLDTTATNVKKSKSAQFDDLFNDDKTDDLPF